MQIVRLSFPLCGIVALASCARDPVEVRLEVEARLARVEAGMMLAEVEKLMGEPDDGAMKPCPWMGPGEGYCWGPPTRDSLLVWHWHFPTPDKPEWEGVSYMIFFEPEGTLPMSEWRALGTEGASGNVVF